ncbi:MAG: hypothetical protein ACLGPL_04310 [Acidobacteriota bacterium]
MKFVRLLLIACFVLSLAACGVQKNWELAGKWKKTDGNEILEFSRTGTVTITNGGTIVTVPFQPKDSDSIQISLGSLGSVVAKVGIQNGTLILKDAAGKESKYQKVQANPQQAQQQPVQKAQPEAKPQQPAANATHAPAAPAHK